MTGREIFSRALSLAGYTDSSGNTNARQFAELQKNALVLVDQICADLHGIETDGAEYTSLRSMDEAVALSERTAGTVAPYGVAMYAAQLEGDDTNQGLFAALYNQKRSSVSRPTTRIRDVLPKGEW